MDGKERIDASLKAMKFLWEACYGKPGQAIQLEGVQASKTELVVRWMPPDPADRSNPTIPEPDL